ncbi:MAG: hypothetical protein ACRDGA_12840 [Bacteroidota bacterium]
MKKTLALLALLCSVCCEFLAAQPNPSPEDRVRLREVFRLAESVQDSVWRGWSKAPFAVLLVTPDHEFLLRHPRATHDFDTVGYDDAFQSLLLYRKRLFGQNLLATFPAINGYVTIVVGQLKNTNLPNSTAWILTLLHEHFHQLQMSQPNYFADTEALGLSRGDQTGMWMLNYPFPYDSALVNERFSTLCIALSEALEASPDEFPAKLSAYRAARRDFQQSLSPDDYRYFSFQVWQEGVARYAEWRVAKHAASHYHPTQETRALSDYRPFAVAADSLRAGILGRLPRLSLAGEQRTAFYPFGAAEAMLLDRANPRWQELYLKNKFFLEAYYL